MSLKRIGLLCFPALVFSLVLSIAVPGSGADKTSSNGPEVLALRQNPLFARLDDGQLRKVAEAAELRQGQKGERIIAQGSRIGKMFIALDTEVQVRIGGELIVLLPANSLVGEIEFLIDVPATADVLLNGNSRVLVMEHGPLRRVMDAHPGIGYVLMDEFAKMEAHRLRMNNERRQK
ncbi:MAG: cyclic nucleotide-binding domain-containing protein [Pseudomonadota bacterium]